MADIVQLPDPGGLPMRRLTQGVAATLLLAFCLLSLAADRPVPPSGIDRSTFDPAVRPQDDLFRHVNGAWLAKAEIPADRAVYGSFVQLVEKAEADLRAIIEKAAADSGNPPGSDAQKIGDLYVSYMDEARADRLGL